MNDGLRDGQARCAADAAVSPPPSEATAEGGLVHRAKVGQAPTAALAPLGHNQPPPGDRLEMELEPLRQKQAALIAAATAAVITDSVSAGKVLDLSVQCRAFEDDIESRRSEHIKPLREAERLINERFGQLRREIQIVRVGVNSEGGLRSLLTAWDDRQTEAAAREQAAADQESRLAAEAAVIARRKADEAAAAIGGLGAIQAELGAARAEAEARRAAERAQSIRQAPVRGHLGQVSRRREYRFEILDPAALVQWLLDEVALKGGLLTALRTIIGGYLRTLGVEAIAKGVVIPGVRVWIEMGVANVRR